MKKYRIKEIITEQDKQIFMPQYRNILYFWCSYYEYDGFSDIRYLITFNTLNEAEYFLEIKQRKIKTIYHNIHE